MNRAVPTASYPVMPLLVVLIPLPSTTYPVMPSPVIPVLLPSAAVPLNLMVNSSIMHSIAQALAIVCQSFAQQRPVIPDPQRVSSTLDADKINRQKYLNYVKRKNYRERHKKSFANNKDGNLHYTGVFSAFLAYLRCSGTRT